MLQAIRRFLVGEDGIAGSALIEFAVCAPMLVVMSIYTMDFSLAFYRQMQVQNAAQAGVDWAMANHIVNAAAITSAVTNAATPPVSVSTGYPIEQCGCPSSTGVTLTANTAPTPCPVCAGGAAGGLYVTVQTQDTWNAFISYDLFSSGSRTFTASATARIQ
jgi:Flp pilus assembly protein TadG